MGKHTPGHWKETGNWYLTTSSGTSITCKAIMGAGRKVAAVITDTREIENWGEMRANAKLIAAAPELLEACEEMCEWLEFVFGSQFAGEPAHRKAREAIRKAKKEEVSHD